MAVRTPLKMTTSRFSLMVYLRIEVRLCCESNARAPAHCPAPVRPGRRLRCREELTDPVEPFQRQVFVQLERDVQPRTQGTGGAAGKQAHKSRCRRQSQM